MSEETVVQYWWHTKPIPDGWKFVCRMQGHHGARAILIKKINPNKTKQEADK